MTEGNDAAVNSQEVVGGPNLHAFQVESFFSATLVCSANRFAA